LRDDDRGNRGETGEKKRKQTNHGAIVGRGGTDVSETPAGADGVYLNAC
jgi:hypothetical protein